MRIYNQRRQSGKTKALIEQIEWVNIFYGTTKNIWVVVCSNTIKECIKRELMKRDCNPNIQYCTYMGHTNGQKPDFVFVDEYQQCNADLIKFIKQYHSDITVMWGTPVDTAARRVVYGK